MRCEGARDHHSLGMFHMTNAVRFHHIAFEVRDFDEIPTGADSVAGIGENRKMIVFPLDEMPEMGRGRGVKLQSYKDGGLADAVAFRLEDGLSWTDSAGRLHTRADLAEWLGVSVTGLP